MLYLVWALLNIVLFFSFIAVCFKATALIRRNIGTAAAVIFVFGLLSFTNQANSDKDNLEPHSNQIKTWHFVPEDSLDGNSTWSVRTELEKTLVSTYTLGVKYGKDKELKNYVPISAYTSVTGFQSGTSWNPQSITINRADSNFSYEVSGTVKWKLLGFTIYEQPKLWKGVAAFK